MLVWGLIVLTVPAVVAVVSWFRLLAYIQSEDFCRELGEILRERTHSESITLAERLKLDGNRVSLAKAEVLRGDSLQRAAARGISAELNRGELLDRRVHITKLVMEEADISLDFSRKSVVLPMPVQLPVEQNEAVPPPADKPAAPPAKKSSVSLQLDRLECKDSDIRMTVNDSPFSFTGGSGTAVPTKRGRGDGWQLSFENGRLHTPYDMLKDSSVRNATFISSSAGIRLTDCCLMLRPGELRVRGNYALKDGRWSTVLRANKVGVERILNNDWKKRLLGELYGELELTGSSGKLNSGQGVLSLQKGMLEALPILSELPLKGDPYRRLALEKAECRLSYPYSSPEHNIHNAWLFDGIDIRSAGGLLTVKGYIVIGADRSLGGTLTIGLPENRVRELMPATDAPLTAIFNKGKKDGCLWLNLNLSGTLDDPHEDLSVRLTTVLTSALSELRSDGTGGLPSLLNSFFPTGKKDGDDSTSPEKNDILPSAGKLLENTLTPFFKR